VRYGWTSSQILTNFPASQFRIKWAWAYCLYTESFHYRMPHHTEPWWLWKPRKQPPHAGCQTHGRQPYQCSPLCPHKRQSSLTIDTSVPYVLTTPFRMHATVDLLISSKLNVANTHLSNLIFQAPARFRAAVVELHIL